MVITCSCFSTVLYLVWLGMRGETIKGHLDLLLLSVLEHEPLHGYAVIGELKKRSNEAFDLPEGTVYPALHRLERQKLITSRWQSRTARRRREYSLTPSGRRSLARKRAEWAGFAGAVGAVVGEAP